MVLKRTRLLLGGHLRLHIRIVPRDHPQATKLPRHRLANVSHEETLPLARRIQLTSLCRPTTLRNLLAVRLAVVTSLLSRPRALILTRTSTPHTRTTPAILINRLAHTLRLLAPALAHLHLLPEYTRRDLQQLISAELRVHRLERIGRRRQHLHLLRHPRCML